MSQPTKPTALKLKALLKRVGVSQAAFARSIQVSPGTLADILNRGYRTSNWDEVQASVVRELQKFGVSESTATKALQHRAAPVKTTPKAPVKDAPKQKAQGPRANANPGPSAAPTPEKTEGPLNHQQSDEGDSMLLRKHTIAPQARKHFNLFRDPFVADVCAAEDVFLTPDIRYVRETMWATAKHGGMLAVIAESGAGKSTLRRDLLDRIQREQVAMTVIEPYVLAMEENDSKGKTLKSAHIAEAIARAVNPLETPKSSPEARFAQVHRMLKDSVRSGNKHVLIIEEAHCLPISTLKHLKRFLELEDGFKQLLSIVLIGQPELRKKLSESNAAVREVVQRCEIVSLPPLDNHLAEYLAFKLARVGSSVDQVFEKDAIDALRAKLTFTETRARPSNRAFGQAESVSLLYPLAIANVVAAAMNMAVEIGAPLVSADLVKEV